ncbi:CPBP family intramembrane metalloprotease [Humibacter sp. BT305]|nr:CPBP family intramembrane metalloprotease [Humibacter sp. BT305]
MVMPWTFYLASAGPLLGAVAATVVGRDSLRVWFRRTYGLRGTGRAFGWVAASIGVYVAVAAVLTAATGGDITGWGVTGKLPGVPGIVAALLWLVSFGLGEESGWRGWLMPHLMQRLGFFSSATLVTAVWLLWHAPAFLFNPTYTGMGAGIVGWGLALLAGSVWLGWVCQIAGWSVLPVLLWHGFFDVLTTSDLLPASVPATISTLVMAQAAAVTIILVARRRLTQPANGPATGP